MTAHDHREFVEGCFRCDLSRAETAPVSADERVEAVLAEHRRVWDHYSPHCSCGKWRDKRDDGTMHAAHVAAALAPVLAEVRAEALREAADDYTNSVGATKARPHARQWLRDRANRIGGAS